MNTRAFHKSLGVEYPTLLSNTHSLTETDSFNVCQLNSIFLLWVGGTALLSPVNHIDTSQ